MWTSQQDLFFFFFLFKIGSISKLTNQLLLMCLKMTTTCLFCNSTSKWKIPEISNIECILQKNGIKLMEYGSHNLWSTKETKLGNKLQVNAKHKWSQTFPAHPRCWFPGFLSHLVLIPSNPMLIPIYYYYYYFFFCSCWFCPPQFEFKIVENFFENSTSSLLL